jgi:hypothetical protein
VTAKCTLIAHTVLKNQKKEFMKKLLEFVQRCYITSWETCMEDQRNAYAEAEVTSKISSLRNTACCVFKEGTRII